MEREQVAQVFRGIPLFRSLRQAEVNRLAGLASVRAYRDGATIVRQDDTAITLYCVLSGKVRVVRQSASSEGAVLLAEMGTGAVFGEMALLDDFPRSATVLARYEWLRGDVEDGERRVADQLQASASSNRRATPGRPARAHAPSRPPSQASRPGVAAAARRHPSSRCADRGGAPRPRSRTAPRRASPAACRAPRAALPRASRRRLARRECGPRDRRVAR